jgi:hypothetical protein
MISTARPEPAGQMNECFIEPGNRNATLSKPNTYDRTLLTDPIRGRTECTGTEPLTPF